MIARTRLTQAVLTTVTVVVAAAAALSTTASAGPVAVMSSRTQGEGCTPLELINIPGTSEGTANPSAPKPDTMLAPVVAELQNRHGQQLRSYTVPYPALAFNGMTYADSHNEGTRLTRVELDRLANQCPATKVAIIGYSQGAAIAGDVACEIGSGTGALPAANIVGVGLVSDPHRGTPGATNIGPPNDKVGILGPRTGCGGFGQLEGRVASICVDGDLYCGIDKARDPVLVGIADILGNATTGQHSDSSTTGAAEGGLAESLVADFSHADLAGLPADLTQLVQAAGGGDSATVARLAAKIGDSLTPLAGILTDTTGSPAIERTLKTGAAGSPDAITASVLDTLKSLDLGKAIDTANRLANTALAGGGGARPEPRIDGADAHAAPSMADSAATLGQQIAPLTTTPTDQLAVAGQILSTVKPKVWVSQILNIATGTLSLAANLPKLLDTLGRIGPILLDPNLDIWGKISQLRDVAEQFNVLMQPVVKMAAAVDLHTAANLIGMIPDPNGIAQIASVVVGLLANVDVIALANEVGRIQNTAWDVLESCRSGCNLMLALPLIDSGLKFAEIALNALTGSATKTAPDQLGATTATGAKSLPGAAEALAGKGNGDALGRLIQQGLDATSFFTSGSHTSYGNTAVERGGRNAVQYLIDWLDQRFTQAIGA